MAEVPSRSRPRDIADLLPDELLADVLARLPPRSLAASRCVRKHWRATIDDRRLLRADLLPLRLAGFFLHAAVPRDPDDEDFTRFFSRPSTAHRISADLDFLEDTDCNSIEDHCNGLLLLWGLVVNPATRQRVRLPPFPKITTPGMENFYSRFVLVYDPMVSPHYEIVLIPMVPKIESNNIKLKESSEWPPSPFTTQVFSSRMWKWEERSFVREGEAAGTIADMRYRLQIHGYQAVYLRGVLYVHCENDSVMRITLWNDKYRMIKSPAENQGDSYLGKLEKGVCFVLLSQENTWPRFRAWLLNESYDQMEWVLKSDISLEAVVENFPYVENDGYSTPWIVNYQKDVSEVQTEDESEWDFDSGIVLHEIKDKVTTCNNDAFFLGVHPYKEIAFLLVSGSRVVSYHLNSSKVQELGIISECISDSFPYTPCWMGVLSENKY
ncbi:unnamed protein product [Urochloa humidicola]